MYSTTATHASLLARLSSEPDPAAWREFHDRYGELINRFARRRGLQAADADDVVQDVLLALSQAMPGFQYDPSKGKFRAYLKTVTLRVILKRRRQKHGEVDLGDIEQAVHAAAADTDGEEAWEAEWRQYHLRQATRVLESEFNAADRQAFQLYAVEGRDACETATELDLSVDQVYQAKSRILKRLAQQVELQVQEEG
ncbi:MAG: sigma-70 family RNA polymerase sigma factor [Planctomycetes bacterium]|nr:sigma-70 family RNA polymerase sigma factor [Planctomycetota bacterium]